MKNLVRTSPLILLLAFACAQLGHAAEGVGNGKIKSEGVGNIASYRLFASQAMAAAFVKFSTNLTQQHLSESKTRIDNSHIVKGNQRVSSVIFEVFPKGKIATGTIASISDLKDYLGNKKTWTPIKIGETSGFFWENKSSKTLEGEYYLLTQASDVVRVEVHSFSAARGIELITPIVRSFTYDVTPPVIHEIKLAGKSQFSPGDAVRILVRITDDLSGVLATSNLRSGTSLIPVDGSSSRLVLASSGLKKISDDWYAYDFTMDANAESGEYYFGGISVLDIANNLVTIRFSATAGEGFVDASSGRQQPTKRLAHLQPLKLTVVNGRKVDRTPPQVRAMELKTLSVRPGQKMKIWVQLDSQSGFGSPIAYTNYYSRGFSATAISVDMQKQSRIHFNGLYQIVARKLDWVELEFNIAIGFSPGTYLISEMSFEDLNRNRTQLGLSKDATTYLDWSSAANTGLPVVKFEVLPDQRADQVAPRVHEIKVIGGQAGQLSSLELQMHLTDDLSGIDPSAAVTAYFQPIRVASAIGTGYQIGSGYFSMGTKRVTNHISADGVMYGVVTDIPQPERDWFRFVPETKPYLPPGEYELQRFAVNDRAGNVVTFEENEDGFYHRIVTRDNHPRDLGASSIKVVKVNLNR